MDSKEATSKAAATEKSGGRLHSFMVRAGAGIVYAALFIGSLLFGVVPTAVFASVMSVLCCYEFYRIMRLDGKVPNEFVGLVASVLFPLSVLVDPVWLTVINFLLVLLLGLWYVKNPRTRIADVAVTAFGAIYTGYMLSAIVLLREAIPGWEGALLSIGVCASLWLSDSFAYMVGSRFGKHKMVPRSSPRKAGRVSSADFWVPSSYGSLSGGRACMRSTSGSPFSAAWWYPSWACSAICSRAVSNEVSASRIRAISFPGMAACSIGPTL